MDYEYDEVMEGRYLLQFKYSCGQMTINLHEFLVENNRSINRVKKLLKIIRKLDYTEPPCYELIEQLQPTIELLILRSKELYQWNHNVVSSLKEKVGFAERNLNRNTVMRDRVDRKTEKGRINPAWKKLNQNVKESNEEVKDLKSDLRFYTARENEIIRDFKFFSQVKELLGTGGD